MANSISRETKTPNVNVKEIAGRIRSTCKRRNHVTSREKSSALAEKMALTKREIEVLRSMAAHLSNKDIGTALSITEGTVKAHVHHILSKLGVNSRTGAITKSIKRRLIEI